jgi:hypothetical protein
LLAVSAGDVATPLELVVAVAVVLPPNATLDPLPGAVNVTVTPLSRFPPASLTVAWSAVPNAVLMPALCGVPLLALMLAGVPAVFVKLKLAEVPTPATLAVTV